MEGVLLLLQHAEVAHRDCNHCWLHVYNETTGEVEKRRDKPVKRPRGTYPPCCRGRCKKGTPDKSRELLPHNWLAYEHYLGCKATGHFPDDPIVMRNAKIIRMIEDEVAKAEQKEALLMSMMPKTR